MTVDTARLCQLSRRVLLGVCLAALFMAAGCGKGSYSSYVPESETAKKALDAALSSWKQGQRPDRISIDGLSIQPPQDFEWKQGKKLQSYEILAEQPANSPDAAAPKQFSVKLTLAGAPVPVTAVYYIVGKKADMWIYRDKDYQRATGG